jgi:thioredoxin reductase (NADPH)
VANVNEQIRDVIIIGSGPAGYTAAIYTARAQLDPLVFEGSQYGGALMTTTEVENYPGFRDGIMGPDLMEQFRSQAERFGAELQPRDVSEVDLTANPKVVKVGDETHLAHAVIVATGSKYRYLGLDNEQRLLGRGVSACATCDGFFFRGKRVVVVGGGNTAVEEALYLTHHAESVTLVHRRDVLRAEKILQARLFAQAKISVVWDSVVEEVLGGGQPETVVGVRLRDVRTDAVSDLAADGLFVAIGHIPNTAIFAGQVATDAEGYILTEPGSTRTSVPGVFAAGDVQDKVFRQAVTAAGTGCMAALEAERWLAGLPDAVEPVLTLA